MALRYSTVLFDWDGTLGDTLPIWMDAYRQVLAEFDLSPSDAAIAAQFGDWHGVLTLGLLPDDFEPFWLKMQDHIVEALPAADLYSGAAELLERLKNAGAAIALVTTSTRALVQPALERNGIVDLFDAVVTGEDVEHHKPHREPIDKALAALGLDSAEAVMIGDSDKDLGAARAAGVESVLLHMPDHVIFYDKVELLAHSPTHDMSSIADLSDLLFS